jgi:hypothetical protein
VSRVFNRNFELSKFAISESQVSTLLILSLCCQNVQNIPLF